MRGSLSHNPEIVRCPDQTLPKVPLPEPIHDDPARQRVVRACQPVRQLQSAAAAGDWRLFVPGQDDGEFLAHWGTEVVVVPANKDVLLDAVALRHSVSHGGLGRC